LLRSQSSQYRTGTQKGFKVDVVLPGKITDDLMGKSLLIANPFEQLLAKWWNRYADLGK
jgi:hypothetical protein